MHTGRDIVPLPFKSCTECLNRLRAVLCHCIHKKFVKLTASILDSVPVGPMGLLPGLIEKTKKWKDLEFNSRPIELSTTPRLGTDTCHATECSLEVHYPLLSGLTRVWDNLRWKALISQCIEESIEPKTLKKWI
jgi:hypothetical protein